MFLPVRRFSNTINGQPRIRKGNGVSKDSVSLAYFSVPELHPENNIIILDRSCFVTENAAASLNQEITAVVDDNYQLIRIDGDKNIPNQPLLLTDIFKDGKPLYYAHKLKHFVFKELAVDDGEIRVTDNNGNSLDSNYLYKVVYFRTSNPQVYKAVVFTSFTTDVNSNFMVTYNAVVLDEKGQIVDIIPDHKEYLNPQPAYEKVDDLEAAITAKTTAYSQVESLTTGYSYIYVPKRPVTDTRAPVGFRWCAVVTAGTTVYKTPFKYDEVFNYTSLLDNEKEQYWNGWKKLTDVTVKEYIYTIAPQWVKNIINDETINKNYSVELWPEPDDVFEKVEVKTRQDGNSIVYARTKVNTGKLILPDKYVKETRPVEYTFSIRLELVRKNDGNTLVAKRLGSYTVNSDNGLVRLDLNPVSSGHFFVPTSEMTLYRLRVTIEDPTVPVEVIFVDSNSTPVYTSNGLSEVEYSSLDTSNFYLAARVVREKQVFAPVFSIKYLRDMQIKAELPVESDTGNGWYIRIKNGSFVRKLPDKTLLFYVPEYYYQTYDPVEGPPIKTVTEKATVIDDRVIRVKRTPLFVRTDIFGNPTNLEVRINGSTTGISKWNSASGIIELTGTVSTNDVVEVTYCYYETCFEYRGFVDSNGRYWHLDLNPSKGHYVTVRDVDGEIKDVPSFYLLNKTVFVYLRAAAELETGRQIVGEELKVELANGKWIAHTKYNVNTARPYRLYLKYGGIELPCTVENKLLSYEFLSSNTIRFSNYTPLPNYYDRITIDYETDDFTGDIKPGTFRPSTIFHVIGNDSDEVIEDDEVILLAKVLVRPNANKDNIVLIDTRTRGGGLKEEIDDDTRKYLEPESDYYLDIGYFDGEPYPENGVVIVKLPQTILKEYGGRFNREEVREIVKKHMAFGTLPVIEFVDKSNLILTKPSFVEVEIVE